VSPLKYHSWSRPTSSFWSAMKPSTDITLCIITVPNRSPRVVVAGSPDDFVAPAPAGLVKNQSAGIGPLSGGNPCSAGKRRRRVRNSVGVWPVKSLNSLLKWAWSK